MRLIFILSTLLLTLLSATIATANLEIRKPAPYFCDFNLYHAADDPGYCDWDDAPEGTSADDTEIPCKGGENRCTGDSDWQGCSFKKDKKTGWPKGKADCGLSSPTNRW